jgi:hypothetical protein
MQYSPVTKLSSFGKGRESDQANARYISRFGTLQDEMGNRILRRGRAKAVEERLKQVQNLNKSSFRVVVSLPIENANDARKIVEDEIRQRYSSFLSAFHITNDNGDPQPHLHFLVFNDQKSHKLKDMQEIFNLRSAIGERFRQNNFSFSLSQKDLKPKLKQSEIHMKERGVQLWKDDIRHAVEIALKLHDFNAFEYYLRSRGIAISRETTNSLTFRDDKNRKVRLDNLFSNMKNRADIEARLAKNQRQEERASEKKLVKELAQGTVLPAACVIFFKPDASDFLG